MKGLFFNRFFVFVAEAHSQSAVMAIMEHAGLTPELYEEDEEHMPEEFEKIVSAAAELMEADYNDILAAFGEFVTPTLFKLYGQNTKQSWSLMELLSHAGTVVYGSLKMQLQNNIEVAFEVEKVSSDTVKITYLHPAKLLAMGVGIAKAIGSMYETAVYTQLHEAETETEADTPEQKSTLLIEVAG